MLRNILTVLFVLALGGTIAHAQQVGITGNATVNGQLIVPNSTASTSPTTGALQVTGGAGIGGSVYTGTGFFGLGDEIAVTPTGGNTASALSAIAGRIITPMDFGAAGNGTTNDTTAVQNAINAAAASGGPGVLYLDNHYYCINAVTISRPLTVRGSQRGPSGVYDTSWGYAPLSGFKACSINQNLITATADGSDGTALRDFGIIDNAAGQNTSGYAIGLYSTHTLVDGVVITDPCVGIVEVGNQDTISHSQIVGSTYATNPTGCGGIQIGSGTTGGVGSNGSSTDSRVVGNTIYMPGSATTGGSGAYPWGMLIENTGGIYLANNDIVGSVTGTLVQPGTGQTILGVSAINTVLGDSTYADDLTINANGGNISSLSFVGDWFGSAGGWNFNGYAPGWHSANNVTIVNTSGTLDGVMIEGSRFEGAGNSNLSISGGSDITISGNHLCDANQTSAGYGVLLGGGISVSVTGNRVNNACDGHSGAPALAAGISLVASDYPFGPLNISNNDLSDNTTPLNITGAFISTSSVKISGNAGVNDQFPSITASTSIDVGGYSMVNLTGTAASISNISPFWLGRTVSIIMNSSSSFATGGATGTGICAAVSAPGAVTNEIAENTGTCWIIK